MKFQRKNNFWVLIGLITLSIIVYLWGIGKDLPYIPDVDERYFFVDRAKYMAVSSDYNPGWFANPGSTVLYPLAALYKIKNIFSNDIYPASLPSLDNASPNLLLSDSSVSFYLIGRIFVAMYSIFSIPIIYKIGIDVFGPKIAFLSILIFIFYPLVVHHSKQIRTDSAALFWGMLSLYFCLKVFYSPSLKNHLLSGLAIGLSIASRYFMISLIPFLLAVDLIHIHQDKEGFRKICFLNFMGLIAIGTSFILSTPYLFLDNKLALDNLRLAASSTHLGSDGLSRVGNIFWYLSSAIPASIYLFQTLFLGFGSIFIIIKKNRIQLLLLGYVLLYILLISIHPQHWQRWLIPIFPVLSLITAFGYYSLVDMLLNKFQLKKPFQSVIIILGSIFIIIFPVHEVVKLDIKDSKSSTRIIAREWVINNLPYGSNIVQEWYTAPLNNDIYLISDKYSVADGTGLETYRESGVDYLMVSNSIYRRYFNEPDRYKDIINFYQSLFDLYSLVYSIEPSKYIGGPVIRIYKISNP